MNLSLSQQLFVAFCSFVGGGAGFVAAIWYLFNLYMKEIKDPIRKSDAKFERLENSNREILEILKNIKFVIIGEHTHELNDIINDIHNKVNEMAERSKVDFMLDNTPRFEFDRNGFCLNVNDSFCELTGLSKHEAIGRGYIRAIHERERERITKQMNDAITANLPIHIKSVTVKNVFRDNSEKLAHIRIEPMNSNSDAKYIGVLNISNG